MENMNKHKLNVLYIDRSIVNIEPVKKELEYEDKKITVFYIKHGVQAPTVISANPIIDLIFEDSHDTGIGQFSIDSLIAAGELTGEHYKIDIDSIKHINAKRKISEKKVEFLDGLVERIKRLCKEDEDIITIYSSKSISTHYTSSTDHRI